MSRLTGELKPKNICRACRSDPGRVCTDQSCGYCRIKLYNVPKKDNKDEGDTLNKKDWPKSRTS